MNEFTEEIPTYGDIISLKEWLECCEDGGFIDYDGFGCASNGTHCTKKEYKPSQRNKLPKGTTHIIWFNR